MVNEMRGRLKMAVAARLSGEAPGKANFSMTGTPPMEIRPLESLGELLAAAEMLGRSNFEAAVPVLEILPRLAVTDIATVRRLIEEYDNSHHEVLYTDNGSDFTSLHLEQVAADLKIRLVFSIPGHPRGRGQCGENYRAAE